MSNVTKKLALSKKIFLQVQGKNYRIKTEIDTRLIDEAPARDP